jgi:adenylate cyclase
MTLEPAEADSPVSQAADLSASLTDIALVTYPADLTLVSRVPISRLTAADGTALEWLMSGQAARGGPAELLDGVMARLVAAGQPIFRATLHMSTLHPQLLGFSANWRGDLGVCDELQVKSHMRQTDEYRFSPLRPVIEERRSIRVDPRDPEAQALYPLMSSLAKAGATDYWAFPLPEAEGLYNIMTVSTQCPNGFSASVMSAVEDMLPALALNVDVVSRKRIAENILDAYVGRRTGRRVLAGDIARGTGETIDAIIWVSDMRNFTGLSDTLDGPTVVALLNAYFERTVAVVHAEGGEVLKFIGDGLLAIFPISQKRPAEAAAQAALNAARGALAAIDMLRPDDAGQHWAPLGMGIALHRGPIFFGNIGAPDRVDFTAIGPAVNLAARIEPLSKTVHRRLLMTQDVAALLEEPVDDLGFFEFRGVGQAVEVFASA